MTAMKSSLYRNTQRITIDPGEHYVSRKPEVISTLLGSCVAVCLYDPENRVHGMNHFLLAYNQSSKQTPIIESDHGRYGIYSMELLINDMMKKGADRTKLKAKCFGGGNVLKLQNDDWKRPTVGEVNVQFVREFLKSEKIPIVAACLGGDYGRNVYFVGENFSVYVKRIGRSLEMAVLKDERRFWKKSLDETRHATGNIDFW